MYDAHVARYRFVRDSRPMYLPDIRSMDHADVVVYVQHGNKVTWCIWIVPGTL